MTHDEKVTELGRYLAMTSAEKTDRGQAWSMAEIATAILAKIESMDLTDKKQASPPIVGELVAVGTMDFGEGETTGMFIGMTREEIRAIPRLPMYRRVSVCEVEGGK